METKICFKCENEKELTEFSFRKDTQNYRNVCRKCILERQNEIKTQKFENYVWTDFPVELKCEMCDEVKDMNCFPKRKDTQLGIRRNCKNCLSQRQNIYIKNRRSIDIEFKLACNLRSRTREAFKSKNLKKNNKTLELLGCSHNFFKSYIEFQLFRDMNLENYGSLWKIDHTLPCSSFNLLEFQQMEKCFNWINLRPMYASENISKGNKIDERLYLLQEVKANHFQKLNEKEGFN